MEDTSISAARTDTVPDRRGCLIAFGITVVTLFVIVLGAYVLVGRSTAPRDLGVTFAEADFTSAVAKAGLVWPEPPAGGDLGDYERVYAGSKPLDATFTEAELSALMSFNHAAAYWPIRQMQVRLTGGDTAEAAGVVTYAGRDWPIYLSGSATVTGKTLDVTLASAEVAGVEVPAEYLPLGEGFLERVVNSRLARMPGLNITSVEVSDAGVHVTGTIWETATYVPRK